MAQVQEKKKGARRMMAGREQENLGPCQHCGFDVWGYVDEPREEGRPVHKNICAEVKSMDPMTTETAQVFLDRAKGAEARAERLQATMLRCAEKLEFWGNDEPREVARVLREEASA